MSNANVQKIASYIFNLSEDSIYTVIERFNNNQNLDKTLTYLYIKAFYLHNIKIDLEIRKKSDKFNEIYLEYKNEILNYYKTNNLKISNDLLNDISETFDKSFEFIDSLGFKNIDEGYEFRHYIIDTFELLRKILEKKSKSEIRVDIFENFISSLKNQAEEIIDYARKNI